MSGSTMSIDAAGRRRSPATLPGYLRGRAPRNKGMQFPPDPPGPEEIVLVMRRAGSDRHGLWIRALVAVLWRAGLRISEALALVETDGDQRRGALLIRHGKGDKRRAAGMDEWGFEHLNLWLEQRRRLSVGPLFCVIDGPTRGRAWSATAARRELRELAAAAGVRRRFAPHQLRHAHAVELAREGIAVNVIQRQLGHTDLGTTSTYLRGIDPSESSTLFVPATRLRSPPRQGWRSNRRRGSSRAADRCCSRRVGQESSSDARTAERATEQQHAWGRQGRRLAPERELGIGRRRACSSRKPLVSGGRLGPAALRRISHVPAWTASQGRHISRSCLKT
jgi:Phage integrase family